MDNGAEASEGFSEWEQIQYSPTASSSPRTDMIPIKDNGLRHELSVFPPSRHEDLEVKPEEEVHHIEDEEEVNSSVQDSWSTTGEEAEAESNPLIPSKKPNEIGKILTSGIVKVAARVKNYVGVAFGCGVWSVGAASGVIAAVLLSVVYAKVRRWRRTTRPRIKEETKDYKLMSLIQDKDQKINQLMAQIAHMNELLSARRRVPVLRVS
ncbi:hypothetical protein CCACVL1_06541 [Corchorus capsularis]|uniref:Transmembrane protein n=1 Tax=Corchorus capsularis TaxID=210143 RepID=A0A1R3JEU7_COCAP|nr:hypothetical protein CCACVL1_06541 [Corchorus capsularis]